MHRATEFTVTKVPYIEEKGPVNPKGFGTYSQAMGLLTRAEILVKAFTFMSRGLNFSAYSVGGQVEPQSRSGTKNTLKLRTMKLCSG